MTPGRPLPETRSPGAAPAPPRPRRPKGAPLLEVQELVTRFTTRESRFDPVAGVSFRISPKQGSYRG